MQIAQKNFYKKFLGRKGEIEAVKYLSANGYKILDRNFHSRFGEIDIIASKKDIIAFIEVKTRSENAIYSPREAVDFHKQQKCIKTAQAYLVQNRVELQPRFDVSEILLQNREDNKLRLKEFNYIENAF